MRLKNHLRTVAAGVVATVAAFASYSHMKALALTHGQGEILAAILPLSVDGLLIVASVEMSEDRQAGRRPRPVTRVSFLIGVAASVVANVLAASGDALSRGISAWPAVALLLVVEMLAGRRKRSAPAYGPADTTAAPGPVRDTTPLKINILEDPAPYPVPAPAEPAVPATPPRQPLERGTVPATPVATSPAKPARKPRADRTADRVRKAAAEMPPDSSVAEIAAKAKVSETTARRHLTGGREGDQPQALLVFGNPADPAPAEPVTDAEMAAATASDRGKAST